MSVSNDDEVWANFIDAYGKYREAEKVYYPSVKRLFAPGVDRVALFRRALSSASDDIFAALRVVSQLSEAELMELFPKLVALSRWIPGVIVVRDLIKSLPRDWVLANIEKIAEPFLDSGDDHDYRRLLELYKLLDQDLTLRLAHRAASHLDPYIREAGEEYLE